MAYLAFFASDFGMRRCAAFPGKYFVTAKKLPLHEGPAKRIQILLKTTQCRAGIGFVVYWKKSKES